jgi:hypothetical protein
MLVNRADSFERTFDGIGNHFLVLIIGMRVQALCGHQVEFTRIIPLSQILACFAHIQIKRREETDDTFRRPQPARVEAIADSNSTSLPGLLDAGLHSGQRYIARNRLCFVPKLRLLHNRPLPRTPFHARTA